MSVTDRLARRGKLTITAQYGTYTIRFEPCGPWNGAYSITADKHDLFQHCRLGARRWTGEGTDLNALLVECEAATRPDWHDVEELRWKIRSRRETRTCGPPLPTYRKWHGWRPGQGRWLETSDHKYEYLDGYLRYDLAAQHEFDVEQAARDARRSA